MKSVIAFVKKYPRSTKFTVTLVGLGSVCVLSAGSAASIICGVLFFAEIIYLGKVGAQDPS